MGKGLIVVLVCLSLCSCITSPPTTDPEKNPREIWCMTETPTRPSRETIRTMSRADLDRLIAHNELGEKWCGWTP